jgi:hypothetical protein
MALTDKKLFRLLWILALPAYSVLLANLFLLATERFFFSLESLVYFYLTVGIVFSRGLDGSSVLQPPSAFLFAIF